MNEEHSFEFNGETLVTFGDVFNTALKYAKNNKKLAAEFFNVYVKHIHDCNPELTDYDCVERAKANVGYFAGYYGASEQKLVQKVYDAVHPVFGKNYWEKSVKENLLTAASKGKYDLDPEFINSFS